MARRLDYKSNPDYQKTLLIARHVYANPAGITKTQIVDRSKGLITGGEFDEYEDDLLDYLLIKRKEDFPGAELGTIKVGKRILFGEVFIPWPDTTLAKVRRFLQGFYSLSGEELQELIASRISEADKVEDK
jgi:hypothetical protein